MSVRVRLRGMLRLIRVDNLRRVHNVGFLAGQLKFSIYPAITPTDRDYFVCVVAERPPREQ